MLKGLLSAAIISAVTAASAWAAPAISTLTGLSSSDRASGVTQVRRRVRRGRYRAGGRYRRAPRGWRRYGARPYDWRTRGCIIVGPVWFCP